MSKKISGESVERSLPFKSAKGRASKYANDADKLSNLLDKARTKAISRKAPLAEVWDSLMACLRLLGAYASDQYKDIPWASLVSIIASVLYFVMPVDLIPDFILGLGLIDDAALLGWIISSVKSDIDNFIEWETTKLPDK